MKAALDEKAAAGIDYWFLFLHYSARRGNTLQPRRYGIGADKRALTALKTLRTDFNFIDGKIRSLPQPRSSSHERVS
jgi:hypothetical protein